METLLQVVFTIEGYLELWTDLSMCTFEVNALRHHCVLALA
jgi:hypothetical protein